MSGRSQAAQYTWSCLFSAQGTRRESFQQSGDALFPLWCPYPKNSTHMHTHCCTEKKSTSHIQVYLTEYKMGNRSIRKGRKRKPQWPFYLRGKIHMRWRRESMNCTIKVCEEVMNKENRWFNYCAASRGSITEGLESCVSIKKKMTCQMCWI